MMVSKIFHEQATSIFSAIRHLVYLIDLDLESLRHEKHVALNLQFGRELWDELDSNSLDASNVERCFHHVYEFLKNLYHQDKERLKEVEVQKGIRAVMLICSEAAQNLEKGSDIQGIEKFSISKSKEYQLLMEFYQKKLSKRLKKITEQEEIWDDSWGETLQEFETIEHTIESIRSVIDDNNYELFFIRQEDGSRFFTHDLLRHITLVKDFYNAAIDGILDDPFKGFKNVFDKTLMFRSKNMLNQLKTLLTKVLKLNKIFKTSIFYQNLCSVIYALSLSASPNCIMSKTKGKRSAEYFRDAFKFLIELLESPDFKELTLESKNKDSETIVNYVEELLLLMFTSVEEKGDIAGLINSLLKKDSDSELRYLETNSNHLWNSFIKERDFIEKALHHMPSSALYTVLDTIMLNDGSSFYSPLLQNNYPSSLYKIHGKDLGVKVVKMPAPVDQDSINHAKLNPLFESFIKACKKRYKKFSYLIINTQDKTDWKEHARSKLIESLSSEAIKVITLPKSTDFYFQIEDYESINSAKDFKQIFLNQICSSDSCGYHFQGVFKDSELKSFTKTCLEFIHESIFGSKDNLSKKNRQDFIDIFYGLISLKAIEKLSPTHLSFMCKDGLDDSMGLCLINFALCKSLGSDSTWSEEEEDFFSYLAFSQSLLVRQRAPLKKCFDRSLCAISTLTAEIDLEKNKVLKKLRALFSPKFFESLCVSEMKN